MRPSHDASQAAQRAALLGAAIAWSMAAAPASAQGADEAALGDRAEQAGGTREGCRSIVRVRQSHRPRAEPLPDRSDPVRPDGRVQPAAAARHGAAARGQEDGDLVPPRRAAPATSSAASWSTTCRGARTAPAPRSTACRCSRSRSLEGAAREVVLPHQPASAAIASARRPARRASATCRFSTSRPSTTTTPLPAAAPRHGRR